MDAALVGYSRIRRVNSFHELIATPFANGINAVCWERTIPGGFNEVVEQLGVHKGITTIDDARLHSLPVSAAGRAAVQFLLEDQRLLREHGLSPEINCIDGYPRGEEEGVFHVLVLMGGHWSSSFFLPLPPRPSPRFLGPRKGMASSAGRASL